jgi:putative selenate reductase
MAELVPAPFRDLVVRLFREPAAQESLFDLPKRAWFSPAAGGPDFGVKFHGKSAGNPLGPASGPHTQMAQNLVLAYIGGGRIMELKTVQINDRLEIPRPCIDMTNVGYNVEWSQELRVEESLREYVAGMMLIEMLRRCHPGAPEGLAGPAGDVIYDISLGYDLKGIKSDKIQAYLDGIRDTRASVEKLRAEIPASLKAARDLAYPTCLSNTLTLSTFHGCPTDEIEKICEFLLAERGLDVIVKMNPPSIGREQMEHLLHDVMGYTEITVRPEAYAASQTFDESVQMTQRLRAFAKRHGRNFGCKFSNTLEVINHRKFFTPDNKVMYLSGTPLHVITLTLAARFREAVGAEVPITFSAGIDTQNVASAVACGFAPITSCSDLLKPGGYGRFADYLKAIGKSMGEVGAATIDAYILKVYGKEAEARKRAGAGASEADVVRWAGVLNTAEAAKRAAADPRYKAETNRREPKRVDSHLAVFDCLTCDKCIPVCPNDANFVYPAPAEDREIIDLVVGSNGWKPGQKRQFKVTKKHQIANYAEFCNECGNCDTFCPEYGGPYIEKPSFYRTEESYTASAPRDGFIVGGSWIRGRVKGAEFRLEFDAKAGQYRFRTPQAEAVINAADYGVASARLLNGAGEATVDMGIFHSLRVMRGGVLDASRVNQVNAAFVE